MMSRNDRTLVFGGEGRLGHGILSTFPNCLGIGRSICDVTDRRCVRESLDHYQPSVVINCAAVTGIQKCEDDSKLAWEVNVYGARNVAEACLTRGIRSVQISSNWSVDPVNEYSWTKRVSEDIGFSLVVRVCYYDETFWLFETLAQEKRIDLLDSDIFNPISISSFLPILRNLTLKGITGTINVGTQDRVSHYEFGVLACQVLGFQPSLLRPVESLSVGYQYPTNTYLPPHPSVRLTVLDDLKSFRESLSWGVSRDEEDLSVREEVQDLRESSRRDSRLR